MTGPNSPHEDQNLRASERLKRALAGLQKERIRVPPQVDEAILSAARKYLQKPPAHRRVWQPLMPWAALAASFVLLAWLVRLFYGASPVGTLTREDINHDGRVDILDAFALARQIERGDKGLRDVNGDGVVDQRDAEEIARHAVKLEKGRRS